MTTTINASTSSGLVNTADTSGILQLQTASTAAVTIDASQNVGIGTSSPSSFGQLAVVTSGNPVIYVGSSTASSAGGISIQGSGAGSYPSLNFNQSATNYWTIGQRADTNLYLYRQTGSGNVIIPTSALQVATTIGVGASPSTSGAGITFPATQSASSDANTLDDYEEGTFTPTLTNSGSSSTFGIVQGKYTKIGRVVTCVVSFDGGASGSATGSLLLAGLPFAATSSNWGNVGSWTASTGTVGAVITPNGSSTTFQFWVGGGAVSSIVSFATAYVVYQV